MKALQALHDSIGEDESKQTLLEQILQLKNELAPQSEEDFLNIIAEYPALEEDFHYPDDFYYLENKKLNISRQTIEEEGPYNLKLILNYLKRLKRSLEIVY